MTDQFWLHRRVKLCIKMEVHITLIRGKKNVGKYIYILTMVTSLVPNSPNSKNSSINMHSGSQLKCSRKKNKNQQSLLHLQQCYFIGKHTKILPWLLGHTPIASLQRGKTPSPNECPWYDTKQSDGEVPVMLELWGTRSTPLLPSLLVPIWPGVVASDRILWMCQI